MRFPQGTICLRGFLLACAVVAAMGDAASIMADDMDWKKLAPIPDAEGFAGPFAGTHKGVLMVAGGANFPSKKPWEGGTKVWYDDVFVLEKPAGQWRRAGRLSRPLGYGVSVSTREGILCAGGSDAAMHHAGVFRLEWSRGSIVETPMPPLPAPCANMCGAVVKDVLYIMGGIETPAATEAKNTLWALNLKQPRAEWQVLEPLPGRGRMLSTAGAAGDSLFIFSGAALKAGPDGKPVREWLRDAWRYTPGMGWKRLADVPRVAVAAPSPAAEDDGRLLVLGGDDGSQIDVEPTNHNGFPRGIQAFDVRNDRWEMAGDVPFSLVTTTTVRWRGRVVIPGGEAKPGVRSTEVWSADD